MPSLTPTPTTKFLLDENVRVELYQFLKQSGLDVQFAPKGSTDQQVAKMSKTENRILVTNDEDFINCTRDEIFSVVWLRVAQHDAKALISSSKKLIRGVNHFSGKLFILTAKGWDEFPLAREIKLPPQKSG